jgi:phosphoribosylanthranilate isomerase
VTRVKVCGITRPEDAELDPFAVDVASGTEASPGVKDPAKVRAFAEAVRPSAEDEVAEPAALPATEPAA